jgi:hypothetical protein
LACEPRSCQPGSRFSSRHRIKQGQAGSVTSCGAGNVKRFRDHSVLGANF